MASRSGFLFALLASTYSEAALSPGLRGRAAEQRRQLGRRAPVPAMAAGGRVAPCSVGAPAHARPAAAAALPSR